MSGAEVIGSAAAIISGLVIVALPILLHVQGRRGAGEQATARYEVEPTRASRPAGPGAEGMYVPEAGEIAPGPAGSSVEAPTS